MGFFSDLSIYDGRHIDNRGPGLTVRQAEIYEFIIGFLKENHSTPHMHDIMKHFNFRSTGSVRDHLCALERKGMIENFKKAHRRIKLTGIEIEIKYRTQ